MISKRFYSRSKNKWGYYMYNIHLYVICIVFLFLNVYVNSFALLCWLHDPFHFCFIKNKFSMKLYFDTSNRLTYPSDSALELNLKAFSIQKYVKRFHGNEWISHVPIKILFSSVALQCKKFADIDSIIEVFYLVDNSLNRNMYFCCRLY